jgi:hypothetical protein
MVIAILLPSPQIITLVEWQDRSVTLPEGRKAYRNEEEMRSYPSQADRISCCGSARMAAPQNRYWRYDGTPLKSGRRNAGLNSSAFLEFLFIPIQGLLHVQLCGARTT